MTMKKISLNRDNINCSATTSRAAVLLDMQYRSGLIDEPNINLAPIQSGSTSKCNASQRLCMRKALFEKRRRISDYASVFSMFGLVLMVVEDELTSAGVYTKASIYSTSVKSLISISTVILLCFVLAHHYMQMQIYLIDNCTDDWRLAMAWKRVSQILLELAICAVHPIPGEYYFWERTKSMIKTSEVVYQKVSSDIMLSLPMFLRLYLVCRSMLLRSNTFSDTTSRSVGAMNRINFDMKFVLKTLLHTYPGTVLLVFIISFWIIASWTLRQCERNHLSALHFRLSCCKFYCKNDIVIVFYEKKCIQVMYHTTLLVDWRFHNEEHADFLDAVWVIVITFLTIGYGDIVPSTYCGRSIAVLTGIMSTGCTALLVAVISQKLELTKAERDVNAFMMQTQLSKKKKEAAAKVLCETWMIYKYSHLVKTPDRERIRAHQRRFLSSIHVLRKVRMQLQKLSGGAHATIDLPKVACMLDKRMTGIEDKFNLVQTRLESMPDTVTRSVIAYLGNTKQETNALQ